MVRVAARRIPLKLKQLLRDFVTHNCINIIINRLHVPIFILFLASCVAFSVSLFDGFAEMRLFLIFSPLVPYTLVRLDSYRIFFPFLFSLLSSRILQTSKTIQSISKQKLSYIYNTYNIFIRIFCCHTYDSSTSSYLSLYSLYHQ